MPRRFNSVLKLAVLFTTVLLTGIGIFWAADVLSSNEAGEWAIKTLLVMGVMTVGMLVVASLGGGPSGPSDEPPASS